MKKYVKIGQIVNTHGYKGELKVYPLTDDIARFYDLKRVFIHTKELYQEYTVQKARIHKGLVIVELCEINDMNGALELKGLYMELPVNELKPLPPGHYYMFEIIGLEVFEDDTALGRITDILKTGSNDVYQVENETGKKLYIPALKDVVRKIDLESGRIEVILPPGLLD